MVAMKILVALLRLFDAVSRASAAMRRVSGDTASPDGPSGTLANLHNSRAFTYT